MPPPRRPGKKDGYAARCGEEVKLAACPAVPDAGLDAVQPFALESFGRIGPAALSLLRSLRQRLAEAAPAVAAVPRERPVCGTFLNCSDARAMGALRDRGVDAAALNAFNAGVLVVDLARWKRLGMTEVVEGWLELNREIPIFALGTNPPLMLATNGRFERLEARWNCQVGSGHPCARALRLEDFEHDWARLRPPERLLPPRRRHISRARHAAAGHHPGTALGPARRDRLRHAAAADACIR